jgi:uncharacterized RDD family membrane protein YckC
MDNQKYQTGLKRLGAAIVDGIVFTPLLLVDQWLLGNTDNNSLVISWTIFTTFLSLFYSIFAHYKYGQTIGKWVAGIKVLDISETRTLTLRQSILRDSFYLVIEIIGLLYFTFLVLQTGKTEYILNDYRSFADQPILWWALIELISMLTNTKRRAVHDFLARSVVVRT